MGEAKTGCHYGFKNSKNRSQIIKVRGGVPVIIVWGASENNLAM
jgi:hypothetical protein